MAATPLSPSEAKVLLAVLVLNPNGYGVNIRGEIGGSFGTVYAALESLTAKGLVVSREGEATPERGGRPKLLFTITDSGREALHAR